jgi:hypothetical protein
MKKNTASITSKIEIRVLRDSAMLGKYPKEGRGQANLIGRNDQFRIRNNYMGHSEW